MTWVHTTYTYVMQRVLTTILVIKRLTLKNDSFLKQSNTLSNVKTTKGTGAENMILLFIHTIGNFTRNLTKDRDLLLGFFPHDVKTRVIYLSYSRKGKVVEALKQVISHRQIHLNTSLAIIKATIV